jgi:hypothetical protein
MAVSGNAVIVDVSWIGDAIASYGLAWIVEGYL